MNAGDSPFTAVAAGTSPRQVAPGMVIGAKRVFAEPSVPGPWEHGELGELGKGESKNGPHGRTLDPKSTPEIMAKAVQDLEVEIWELKQERLALKERLRNAEEFAARTQDECMKLQDRLREVIEVRDTVEIDLAAAGHEITELRHRVQDLETREFQRRSKAAKRAARTRKVKQRGKKGGLKTENSKA